MKDRKNKIKSYENIYNQFNLFQFSKEEEVLKSAESQILLIRNKSYKFNEISSFYFYVQLKYHDNKFIK